MYNKSIIRVYLLLTKSINTLSNQLSQAHNSPNLASSSLFKIFKIQNFKIFKIPTPHVHSSPPNLLLMSPFPILVIPTYWGDSPLCSTGHWPLRAAALLSPHFCSWTPQPIFKWPVLFHFLLSMLHSPSISFSPNSLLLLHNLFLSPTNKCLHSE